MFTEFSMWIIVVNRDELFSVDDKQTSGVFNVNAISII